jgi:diacylglycerol kinase family enzyme
VTFDGRTEEDHFYTINAGICRYSGGGMQLVPHARPDDGLLALTLARRISKLEVLLVTPLFYAGKIGWHPAVSMCQAKEILVEGLNGDSVLVEADGEFLGEGPERLGLREKALRVVVTPAPAGDFQLLLMSNRNITPSLCCQWFRMSRLAGLFGSRRFSLR